MNNHKKNSIIKELHKDYYANITGPIGGDERFRWIIKTFFSDTVGKSILDVGCGEGTLLKYLQENNNIIGIDVSYSGVEKTKSKGINCSLIDISNEHFPFGDDEFDIVTCLETIEHIENPLHCIQEIKRVLKEGGTFIVSIPNPKILHPYCYPGLFQLRFFKEFLENNNFEIERIIGWGQAIMFNKLMQFLKDKKGIYKFIYNILYYLSRKRNLFLRKHFYTPLSYSYCINFLCTNHKTLQNVLQEIAIKTTPH